MARTKREVRVLRALHDIGGTSGSKKGGSGGSWARRQAARRHNRRRKHDGRLGDYRRGR